MKRMFLFFVILLSYLSVNSQNRNGFEIEMTYNPLTMRDESPFSFEDLKNENYESYSLKARLILNNFEDDFGSFKCWAQADAHKDKLGMSLGISGEGHAFSNENLLSVNTKLETGWSLGNNKLYVKGSMGFTALYCIIMKIEGGFIGNEGYSIYGAGLKTPDIKISKSCSISASYMYRTWSSNPKNEDWKMVEVKDIQIIFTKNESLEFKIGTSPFAKNEKINFGASLLLYL